MHGFYIHVKWNISEKIVSNQSKWLQIYQIDFYSSDMIVGVENLDIGWVGFLMLGVCFGQE